MTSEPGTMTFSMPTASPSLGVVVAVARFELAAFRL